MGGNFFTPTKQSIGGLNIGTGNQPFYGNYFMPQSNVYSGQQSPFGSSNMAAQTPAQTQTQSQTPGLLTPGTATGNAPATPTGGPYKLPSMGTSFQVGSANTGVSPLDTSLSNQFLSWLQQQTGKGATPYGGSVPLPTGGTTTPGTLTAPLNPLEQQLQQYFMTGKSNIPGSDTMTKMAQTGMPIDQTAAWNAMVQSMQQQIENNAALLREQYNVGGMNPATGSAGSLGMANYYEQTSKDLNAQLLQAQTTALENAAGRQQASSQFLQSAAQSLGNVLQGYDQTAIQNALNEFIRTQPEYSPLLNALYGAATTFPPTVPSSYSPGLAALLGALPGLLQAVPGIVNTVKQGIGAITGSGQDLANAPYIGTPGVTGAGTPAGMVDTGQGTMAPAIPSPNAAAPTTANLVPPVAGAGAGAAVPFAGATPDTSLTNITHSFLPSEGSNVPTTNPQDNPANWPSLIAPAGAAAGAGAAAATAGGVAESLAAPYTSSIVDFATGVPISGAGGADVAGSALGPVLGSIGAIAAAALPLILGNLSWPAQLKQWEQTMKDWYAKDPEGFMAAAQSSTMNAMSSSPAASGAMGDAMRNQLAGVIEQLKAHPGSGGTIWSGGGPAAG